MGVMVKNKVARFLWTTVYVCMSMYVCMYACLLACFSYLVIYLLIYLFSYFLHLSYIYILCFLIHLYITFIFVYICEFRWYQCCRVCCVKSFAVWTQMKIVSRSLSSGRSVLLARSLCCAVQLSLTCSNWNLRSFLIAIQLVTVE